MEPRELTLVEIGSILWQRKKLITIIVGCVTIITIVVSLILPKWYKATAIVLPPSSEKMPFNLTGIFGQLGFSNLLGGEEEIDRFMAILKSRTLHERVIGKYNLMEKYDTDTMEKTIKALKGNLDYEIDEENQIVISILDRDQDLVADMVNYIVHTLDSINIALQTNYAHNTREFIGSRLQITLDSLKYLENRTRQFMKTEGILSIDDQIYVTISNAAELKAQIMSKEIELTVAQKTLEPNNSYIKKLQVEIESLKNKYGDFYSGRSLDRLFLNLSNVPDLQIEYIQIKRMVEYYTKLVEFLGPQYERAKIEEAKKIPTLQVLDYGERPELKDKPRRARIVIVAFILSLGASILIAYFQGRWEILRKK